MPSEDSLFKFLSALDCGDNSCVFAPSPRTGMRTNGGCRCLENMDFAQQRKLHRELRMFYREMRAKDHDDKD